MKTYTTKIKAVMLTSAIFTSSLTGFSQQLGDDCSNTKVLPTPALTCSQSNENINKKERWYKLKTNGRALEVTITHPSTQSADINKIKVIDGDCQQPLPITETSTINNDGSISVTTKDLVPGQEVFIKVERDNATQGNFTICVKEVPYDIIPAPTPPASLALVKPMLAQGYMVLDEKGLDVDRWQVTIVQNNFIYDTLATNESEAFSNKLRVVDRFALTNGINYFFVPYEYRRKSFNEVYTMNVVGIGSNGERLIEETNILINDENIPVDEPPLDCAQCVSLVPTCDVTCVSGQYAYRVQQFQNPNIPPSTFSSRFEVHDAWASFDPNASTASPYYWYIEFTKFQLQCASIGVGCIAPSPNATDIVGPFNASNATYRDPAGNVLSGMVVGIRKTRGPWKEKILMTELLNINNSFCSSTIQTAYTVINDHADFYIPSSNTLLPPLECVAPFNAGSGSGSGSGGATSCFDAQPSTSPTDGPSDIMNAVISATLNCLCTQQGLASGFCDNMPTGIGEDPIYPWLELIDRLIIADLNDPNKPPLTVITADLFESNNGNGQGGNGKFKGLNFTLEPGLYSIGMAFNTGEYERRIIEIDKEVINATVYANLADVSAFPSPIITNKYDVKIDAQATLTIAYELRDFTGELILTRTFNVHKAQEKTFKITDNNIPNGILFHRFVFEDGSTKSIQTIKN